MTIDGQVCYDDGESGEDPKCIAYDMSKDGASYSVSVFPFSKTWSHSKSTIQF